MLFRSVGLYEQIGCRTHILPYKSWLRGGGMLRSTRNIICEWRGAAAWMGLLNEMRPTLVYINSLPGLAAAVAARKKKLPVVWHLREMFDDVGGEMIRPAIGGKGLVRLALRHLTDRVVAISHAVLSNVAGAIPDERHCVVPNAADEVYFNLADDPSFCRRSLGLREEGLIIGVPGTLRRIKGHPFFLSAAESVLRSNPNVSVAITGSGPSNYVEELKTLVRNAGIEARVHFLGEVNDMPRFYRACDLICVPSRSEGFGRTVIEACAVGVPVIATNVGGIPEVIDDGETGLLVSYGDVPALAEAIKRVLNDQSLRFRLADAARQKAKRSYRVHEQQKSIIRVVEDVLQARSAPLRST